MKDQPGAPVETPLTDEEIQVGMNFLKNPDLFGELVRDLDALGYVGEEPIKSSPTSSQHPASSMTRSTSWWSPRLRLASRSSSSPCGS